MNQMYGDKDVSLSKYQINLYTTILKNRYAKSGSYISPTFSIPLLYLPGHLEDLQV